MLLDDSCTDGDGRECCLYADRVIGVAYDAFERPREHRDRGQIGLLRGYGIAAHAMQYRELAVDADALPRRTDETNDSSHVGFVGESRRNDQRLTGLADLH